MTNRQFSKLYDDNHGLLYFWLLNRTRNKEAAEDICSYTFAKLWESKSIDNPHAWLFKVAGNRLNEIHRHEALISFEEIPESVPDPRDFTVELEKWYEFQRAANAAMLCTEAEQMALAGAIRGERLNEIARRLGVPAGTVGRRIWTAKMKVRSLCNA